MAEKTLHVYSKLANSQKYTGYSDNGSGEMSEDDHVHVKGGAGLANEYLQTPQGVKTVVTEAQAAFLQAHPVFQLHKKNGFVTISAHDTDVDKVVADMAPESDPGAPLTPADYTDAAADKNEAGGNNQAAPQPKKPLTNKR